MVRFNQIYELKNVTLTNNLQLGVSNNKSNLPDLSELLSGEANEVKTFSNNESKSNNKTKNKTNEKVSVDFSGTTLKTKMNSAKRIVNETKARCKEKNYNKEIEQKLIKSALKSMIGEVYYSEENQKMYEIVDVSVDNNGEINFKPKCLTKAPEKNENADEKPTNFDDYKSAREALNNAENDNERYSLIGTTFRRKSGAKAVIIGWEKTDKNELRPKYNILADYYDVNKFVKKVQDEYCNARREDKTGDELTAILDKYVGKSVYINADGTLRCIKGWSNDALPMPLYEMEEKFRPQD